MRQIKLLFVFLLLFGCEELLDVKREKGPCTILLVDGGTITTQNDIEILQGTGTITYRDEDDKLWSIPKAEYVSYTCGV